MKHLFLIMFSLTTLAKPGISQKKIIVRLNDKQLTHTIQKSGNYIKVAFNDNVMNTFFEKHKIMAFEQAFPLANRFNHPLSKRVSEMYRFTFENTDIDILNKLKEEQYFDFIDEEKDPILLFTPNDLSIQGGLAVLALNKINATEAWDVTKGSASIKIAIIDNGYDVSHPDLANQIVYQDGSVSYGGVGLSHGLPVAGLAAAQTDNGIGVSSIGFNSKLMLYLFYNPFNKMMHASLNGAKVINCSFLTGNCSFAQYEQDIINMITTNGTVVVASAGNGNAGASCDGYGYGYPASYDNVISVSGTDLADSYFTNGMHFTFNNKVDLTAPGWSTWTTFDNNSYSTFAGTSASAPLVSGTIALMLAIKNCLNPAEIEFILKSTVNKSVNNTTLFPGNATYVSTSGSGRLDAVETVKAARDWPQNAATIAIIKGPSPICGTGAFKIINDNSMLAGPVSNSIFSGNVTWASSNPTGLSINSSTGVATASSNFSGPVTITAIINGSCGNSPPITLNVWVGLPLADNSTLIWLPGMRGINPVETNSGGAVYNFNVDAVQGASSYTWQTPSGFIAIGGKTTIAPAISIQTSFTEGTYSLLCRANNNCGLSWTNNLTINNVVGGGNQVRVAIFPNPANSSLNIQITDSLSTTLLSNTLDHLYELSLSDKFSRKVFLIQSSDKIINIPTDGFPSDIYYLNLIYKDTVIRKQVIIKK